MIGIVGGTGLLGRIVAARLFSEGLPVRVIGRSENQEFSQAHPQIEFYRADVGDVESLRVALKGCRSVHISLSGGPTAHSYREIEEKGVKNILRAGENQSWSCITMMSGSSQGKGQPQHISFAAKANAELSIQASGLPYSIIRSSFVMEGLERFVRGKRANYLGPSKQRFHWVSGEDIGSLVGKIHSQQILLNRIIYAYGPEKLNVREALIQYCRTHHPEMKVQGAPFWVMELLGRLTKNAEMVNIVHFLRDIENRGEPDSVENGILTAGMHPQALSCEFEDKLASKLLYSNPTRTAITQT